MLRSNSCTCWERNLWKMQTSWTLLLTGATMDTWDDLGIREGRKRRLSDSQWRLALAVSSSYRSQTSRCSAPPTSAATSERHGANSFALTATDRKRTSGWRHINGRTLTTLRFRWDSKSVCRYFFDKLSAHLLFIQIGLHLKKKHGRQSNKVSEREKERREEEWRMTGKRIENDCLTWSPPVLW